MARSLGFAMARQHLAAGYDVVMPQLLVRDDVIDQVRDIAHGAGADFVEIIVVAPPAELRGRLETSTFVGPHPREQFSLDELTAQIEFSIGRFEEIAASRSDAIIVRLVNASAESSLAAVRAVLYRRTATSPTT